MFDIDDLIGSCVACLDDPDPRGAVREVVGEAMSRADEIADALPPDRAGITLLHQTPELTLINVVWAPGMRLYAHDHRMWAVIAVYAGREDNEFFRRPRDAAQGLVPSNGRSLDAGDLISLGDDTIHAVSNPKAVPTGGIHVYGGDFVNQPRSQWRPPALVEEPWDPAAVDRVFEDANAAWGSRLTMAVPTTAQAEIQIDAPPTVLYDLVTDVTRMGEWSPECVSCEWLDQPGNVGSTFKGHNRQGRFARWTTVARVVTADRPKEFSFATLYKDEPSTRWTYRFEGEGPTTVTESFEAIRTPPLIGFAERYLLRNRQAQLEAGMAQTLARIKAVAEAQA